MAVRQVKKLSERPTTSVSASDKFPKVSTAGVTTLASLNDLKTAVMSGTNVDAILDGVFIQYHKKSNGQVQLCIPSLWSRMAALGEEAEGIAVKDGSNYLLVALTETTMPMAPTNTLCHTAVTTFREAISDLDGLNHTIELQNATGVTADHAPIWVDRYQRMNSNNQGVGQGNWWIPALGELMIIRANVHKINACLAMVSGAQLIDVTNNVASVHMSSTENTGGTCWVMAMASGEIFSRFSKAGSRVIRPVSYVGID